MTMTELRTIKEICDDIRRGRTYVQAVKAAMIASGVAWIGNRITTGEVLAWLREHPDFRTSDFGRRPRRRGKRKKTREGAIETTNGH
jgi:hypothetical protein